MPVYNVPNHTRSFHAISQVTLTVVFAIFVIAWYEPEQVFAYLGKIPASSYVLALALLTVNQLLSSVRFHLLLRDVGARQPFVASNRINILSILGGMVLFNFFGQSLTRSTLLRQTDQSPAMAFILTGLERVIALASLLILGSVSALTLFGGLRVEFDSFGNLVLLVVNVVLVTLAVIWFGIRREQRLLRGVSIRALMGPMLRASVVTLTMQAVMLGAYAVLAVQVAPAAPRMDLIALSAIVMFAAAMPISFAGWGIRELTAASAFGAVGLESGAGLTMAVTVGLLSLAALVVNLVPALIMRRDSETASAYAMTENRVAVPFTKLLCWTVPLVVAMLVVFQVQLPTHTGFVTVNLADPIVIVGALTLAALANAAGVRRDIWQVPGLNASLAVATVALSLGFLHGWVVFGITDWALYNRLLGWLVLICYLLTGALLTTVIGRIGITALFRAYIVACATVVLIELCLRLWGSSLGLGFVKWSYPSFYGMTGNPNAFGFQLVLALAVGLSGGALWGGRHDPIIKSIFLGVILAGVWFTGSRTAVIALACIVALFLGLGRSSLRHVMTAVVVAVVVIVAAFAVIHVSQPANEELRLVPENFDDVDHLGHVQADRTRSIVGGWEMFKSHPIIGAGLGAFMHEEVATTGVPLVIHSSYLWLLAEIGIPGFLAFMLVPASAIRAMWLNRAWMAEWSTVAALGCLAAMAIISLTHDMAYQRPFWLLLGAALACPKCFATSAESRANARHTLNLSSACNADQWPAPVHAGGVKDNIHHPTVRSFGQEWSRFDQGGLSEKELRGIFDRYFRIFPWHVLPERAVGFDLGCGTGRWARCVAGRVGRLHCIDASAEAIVVAKRNLEELSNCEFHQASVECLPLQDSSMDFGYALGVLHHVPDPSKGLESCVKKLAPGAPILVYLYYAFDNRPSWFRWLWRVSDLIRRGVCVLPFEVKYWFTQVIAAIIYYPLARLALVLENLGCNVESVPLSAYRRCSFYTMRTDALDRFGTPMEHRFTASEVRAMMERAGLVRITFSEVPPYWCVVGYKKDASCAG